MRALCILTATVFLFSVGPGSMVRGQTTYYVNGTCGDDAWTGLSPDCVAPDGPKRTIQAGIDAAAEGDTVLIADGTYTGGRNKNLNFAGKNINLRSENGRDHCIIDCQGSGHGFLFRSGERRTAVVDGFTIVNAARGIRCQGGARPTITNCAITHCGGATGGGAGIFCYQYSNPRITNCMIADNSTDQRGGGIYCDIGNNPAIVDCVIVRNLAGRGGAIYCDSSLWLTVSNCIISQNSATKGGGIYSKRSDPTFTDCIITDNTAHGEGGGIYFGSGSPVLFNCIIARNSANSGGAISTTGGSAPTITCCTVSGNSAVEGGGIACHVTSGPTITNCIFWSDNASSGAEIRLTGTSTLTVSYSDVEGGETAADVDGDATLVWGDGNIEADPMFAFADEYHIISASPCIDGGTNNPPGNLPPVDPDGTPRPLDGDGDGDATADIGAYEYNLVEPVVALSVMSLEFFAPEGGPNPDDLIVSLRNAGGGVLDWDVTPDCPWLQVTPTSGQSTGEIDDVVVSADVGGLPQGEHTCVLAVSADQAVNSPREVAVTLYLVGFRYVPAQYPTIQAAIDAAVPGDQVVVADGTYMGPGNTNVDFGGKSITVRSENGPANCVIDCEGRAQGFVFRSGEGPGAVVEGFTITDAYASSGGGILCEKSSPTIRNCVVVKTWVSYGGGIYCKSRSSPTVIGCTIADSRAYYGGGIRCSGGSDATITDCTITRNSADIGGGVYCSGSAPTITNCAITGNSGSGVHCRSGSNPTITNCIVSGNYRGSGAGIYCTTGSTPTVTNCIFVGNSASGRGGAAYADDSILTITNCILWGDTAPTGPEIALRGTSTLTVSYSDVEGGQAAVDLDDEATLIWGDGNIEADPVLAFTDDFHIMPGSPCIDAGTNTPLGGLPPTDPDSNLRLLDGDGDLVAIADMGAYEFNPDAPSIALSPRTAEFFAPEGGPNPDEQILYVRNCGGQTLNWEAAAECSWLDADPAAGVSAGEVDEVTLRVDVIGLDAGPHSCTLSVSDSAAMNSPRAVVVVLHVIGTLRVPSQFPRIQDAIDASVDGDTILVADGTYTGRGNKALDFRGKNITVRSENGADNCIIDCEGSGRGFLFWQGEDPRAVVDGFTVTNGFVYASYGGAISCVESSPTIRNCVIIRCASYAAQFGALGGGIYLDASDATITNCTISENTCDAVGWALGGGIFSWNGNPTITDCVISSNVLVDYSGAGAGGGICSYSGNPLIENCAVAGNSGDDGGGIYCADGNAIISNCTIVGNSIGYKWGAGGGVYCGEGSPTVTNCTISSNTSSGHRGRGGGVGCSASSALITNCMITGNTARQDGGGLFCSQGGATIANCMMTGNSARRGAGAECYNYDTSAFVNCTFAGNTADARGGGIYATDASSPTIDNGILWDNSAPQGREIALTNQTTLAVSYCDVQGGLIGAYVPIDSTLDWGDGNLDSDPLFADPNSDDYHLLSGSPCIDAGDNNAVPPDLLTDLDGNPRIVSGTVDMGAYEFRPPIPASLDIRPGGCPNPLNPRSHGMLPVALLGTAEFDVADVDASTLVLSREGMAGSVAPIHVRTEDATTPFSGELCDCHDAAGDGVPDLVLKLRVPEVVSVLGLDASGGGFVRLTLTGRLVASAGGEAFGASDCVWIVPPADFDLDGDVDLDDFSLLANCFAGSGRPPAGTCPPGVDADLDGDGDVDLNDFALFAASYTGA